MPHSIIEAGWRPLHDSWREALIGRIPWNVGRNIPVDVDNGALRVEQHRQFATRRVPLRDPAHDALLVEEPIARRRTELLLQIGQLRTAQADGTRNGPSVHR